MATENVTKKVSKKATTAKATAKKVSTKAVAKKESVKAAAKKDAAKVKKDVNKAKKEVNEAVDAVEDVAETAVKTVIARVSQGAQAARGVANKAWLAYLGAAGRTYDEVVARTVQASEELQARVAKLNEDRTELVEELVARGEKVQDEAETRLKEGRATVEEQIEVAKTRFAELSTKVDIPARLQDLSDKLESLSKDLKKSA